MYVLTFPAQQRRVQDFQSISRRLRDVPEDKIVCSARAGGVWIRWTGACSGNSCCVPPPILKNCYEIRNREIVGQGVPLSYDKNYAGAIDAPKLHGVTSAQNCVNERALLINALYSSDLRPKSEFLPRFRELSQPP